MPVLSPESVPPIGGLGHAPLSHSEQKPRMVDSGKKKEVTKEMIGLDPDAAIAEAARKRSQKASVAA